MFPINDLNHFKACAAVETITVLVLKQAWYIYIDCAMHLKEV